jgi:hypothetical protein
VLKRIYRGLLIWSRLQLRSEAVTAARNPNIEAGKSRSFATYWQEGSSGMPLGHIPLLPKKKLDTNPRQSDDQTTLHQVAYIYSGDAFSTYISLMENFLVFCHSHSRDGRGLFGD